MYNITLIKGDGIGPEVSDSTKKVIDSLGLDINWEIVNAGIDVFNETGDLVPDKVYKSIEQNKIALKGPITTPVGEGFRSINVMLRKKYDLYCNIRPANSIGKTSKRYEDIDLVIFRENTEGLYVGIENKVSDDEFHAKKIITRNGSYRIIKEAFEYARANKREKVTVAHKANILKDTDGFFLKIAKEIAPEYPEIIFEDLIIDNMCMQLVMNPNNFDVIVTMNLYGDILSDLCAGLIGGLGLIPGANIGNGMAIFEPVHGSAPDIAGKGLANPTAMILSSAMMLDYLGEKDKANLLRAAVHSVINKSETITKDLGGNSTTIEYTDALINEITRIKAL